jgi:O-antigen/teichoic acid export membrane protein
MANTKRFARNVIMNWISMAVGMVVPFFLAPFVIRHLGTTAYGIWILAVSTVSYLNLLDMGLRSAVVRFVSKAQAQDKLDEATTVIGATLWFRSLLAGGVAVLSVALAFAFPHLFKIPPDLQRAGQITVLLCALGVAVSLVSGVFGAVLAAIHRFDVLSTLTMVQTLARAGGVVLILRGGRGLITLAYWELTIITIAALATVGAALKLFPPCRVKLEKPQVETLKMIWNYSLITFVWIIAVQIIINTDNLVVGAFLSVGLVAYYSIGGSLTAYSGQVVYAMSTTFIPLASNLEAEGKSEELQKLLIRGTQATLALALPISLTLIFRGKTFIGLWMGRQYSEISGNVLQILMIAQFFSVATATSGSVMMAIGKHKPAAKAAAFEALLNLGLSLLLVKTVGIYGVAWGTSISNALFCSFFWPRYVCKILSIPVRRFLWEGWLKIVLCSIPFAVVCGLADRYWHPHSLVMFFSQVLATLPVYAAVVFIIFREEATSAIRTWRESKRITAQAAS